MREKTLYEPSFEHDNCGIGAITNIYGKTAKVRPVTVWVF